MAVLLLPSAVLSDGEGREGKTGVIVVFCHASAQLGDGRDLAATEVKGHNDLPSSLIPA